MENSRKPSSPSASARGLAGRVAGELGRVLRGGDRIVVALSGGIDSVVLLDLLLRVRGKLRFRLAAVHVNHQLSPNAGHWAAFCRRLCRTRAIPLDVVTVRVPGEASVEAAARKARYEALLSRNCDYVALAHHLDDQVETFLLQLLRGAGPRGLSGMPLLRRDGAEPHAEQSGRAATGVSPVPELSSRPPQAPRRRPGLLRPLLGVRRAEIEAYAGARGLSWVDDESNSDARYRRNFFRHEVLPVIERRYPAYRTTVARSAGLMAESARLLDDLAELDCAGAMSQGAVAMDSLRRVSPARARNLLRWFLSGCGVDMPSAARLEEALRQVLTAGRDAEVRVDLGERELRRFDGRLHVVVKSGRPDPAFVRPWQGESVIELPEFGGVLELTRASGQGLSLARLRSQPVTVRARRGGERLQIARTRPRRTLKNLLQEARMAPWERDRLPLVFCGDDLVWAAGVGTAWQFAAKTGERSVKPRWIPDGASGTPPRGRLSTAVRTPRKRRAAVQHATAKLP